MSASTKNPVLIVGGAGVVGSQSAKILRQLHPDLPIAIGGRDAKRAKAVAQEIGRADAAVVDLDRADLGLSERQVYGAIAMFVKDDTMHSMAYAQARGVPYLTISTGLFEIGPEVAFFIHAPASAPILMDSNWLAGTATLAALHFAREFRTIEAIEISAVLDEQDMGGPAAYADYERITKAAPNALIRKNSKWLWANGADATRRFTSVDGTAMDGQAYHALDTASLASATQARSVRFDLVLGETSSRRRGEPFSTEIIVEITGEKKDGTSGRVRHELVHPAGQGPMTALGVAIGVERLLGLAGGAPVAPGLYLPETLIDAEYMLRRLTEFGTRIRRV